MNSFVFVGLGNPGEEYENTRHNTGRDALFYFAKENNFSDWVFDKKLDALVSNGKIKKNEIKLVVPEAFMNKSGLSVKPLITSLKKAESLVVLYDEIDLPFGKTKIVFDRGSGGHKGLESIVRQIKTGKFTRIRIGVSPTTPTGKTKKPKGEDAVVKFILGKFKPDEQKEIKKVFKKISEILETIVTEDRLVAMNRFN